MRALIVTAIFTAVSIMSTLAKAEESTWIPPDTQRLERKEPITVGLGTCVADNKEEKKGIVSSSLIQRNKAEKKWVFVMVDGETITRYVDELTIIPCGEALKDFSESRREVIRSWTDGTYKESLSFYDYPYPKP